MGAVGKIAPSTLNEGPQITDCEGDVRFRVGKSVTNAMRYSSCGPDGRLPPLYENGKFMAAFTTTRQQILFFTSRNPVSYNIHFNIIPSPVSHTVPYLQPQK